MNATSMFVRGGAGTVPDLMRRIWGSEHADHSFRTVNDIDCHDAFTLRGNR